MKFLSVLTLLMIVIAVLPAQAQELHETPPPVFFREDFKEIPPVTPITQEHINTDGLLLALHGPGKEMIKKSHHDQPLDDPYYIWSGQCEGTWALTLSKRGTAMDLSNGAVSWRTKNYDRITYIVIGLGDGSWLVSERGTGETPNWQEFTIDFAGMRWKKLNIATVVAGDLVENPDLSNVKSIGFTDLEKGGMSASATRLDFIEVYGRAAAK